MKYDDDKEFDTLSSIWMHMKQQINDEQQKFKSDKKAQSTSQFIPSTSYHAKNLPLQIQQMQEELFQKSRKLLEAQEQINELTEQNAQQYKEIQLLSQEKSLMLSKFESIEEVIDSMQIDKSSNRLIRLENDQLRQDIARLLQLLKTTKEHCDIMLEEGQHYVGSTISKSKIIEQSNKKVDISIKEEIFWIPYKAIDLINETDMSSDQKNELLTLLNSTFFDFYVRRLNKHKQASNSEIQNLKRQINSRIPYDGMMTQKKSERSKGVQFADQKSETKSKKSDTPKNLFHKIEDQLKISRTFDQSKIFMDGATWILERIKVELRQYELGIKYINQELSNKIDSLIEQEDIVYKSLVNKIFKWIIDASDEQLLTLKDKLDTIMETTQSKATTRRTSSQIDNHSQF